MDVKELSNAAKRAVDKMLMEFIETYGIESLKHSAVRIAFADEVVSSAYEFHRRDKITMMKEKKD